jgi:threonylcarbamoyladenosine tRNA methylthiotransferase MtaB
MATPKSVAFYTLGCKLNYSETSSIERLFSDNGWSVSEFEQGADIYVINTCSVTEFADQKCRQIVRRALRQTPTALIVVIGCYAQLKPTEIANIEGVDLVLGAAEKFRILEFIEGLSKSSGKGMVQALSLIHI